MSDDRCFRIDEEDIEDFRDQRMPEYWVDSCRNWLSLLPKLNEAIDELTTAFANVRLGEGTGLHEATGIDDYACDEELQRLRALDEKEDWRKIPIERLNECYAAPSFMNVEGFLFHLPAFLVAELNDRHPYGFIDHLINPDRQPQGWIKGLNEAQKNALAKVLEVVAHHPEYSVDPVRPENAMRMRSTIDALLVQ